MNSSQDNLTGILRTITNVLLLKNPLDTAMGMLFGILLHGLATMLAPYIEKTVNLRISALNFLHYIAIGMFGFNIKNYINRHKTPPEIDEALALIQKQIESGEITVFEAKLLRKALIKKVLDNVTLDAEARSNANVLTVIQRDN
jgi:hypothetical protein